MENRDKIILVTGATGSQGGAVVKHLLKDGWKVRALTRDPNKEKARMLRESGVEVFKGDMDDIPSLETAMRGVYGVFSVQTPWVDGVDAETRQGINVADAAKRSGVQHFIYTSVGSADKKTGIPHFESKYKIEKHIADLKLNWTIFRPVYFMDNFNAPKTRDSILNGTLSLGLESDIPLQIIGVDDIGGFVAMAFMQPERFMSKAIDLAGDELTGAEMAEVLSRVLGKEVAFKAIPIEKMHTSGSDVEMMFDWFNKRGYSADIALLKTMKKDIMSFEEWVEHSDLKEHRAAA